MPDFGAYQNEIYLAGLHGRLPSFPMRFDELEAKAHAAMPLVAAAASDGIVHVLRALLAEADLLMAVDGYPTLADLRPDALQRVER